MSWHQSAMPLQDVGGDNVSCKAALETPVAFLQILIPTWKTHESVARAKEEGGTTPKLSAFTYLDLSLGLLCVLNRQRPQPGNVFDVLIGLVCRHLKIVSFIGIFAYFEVFPRRVFARPDALSYFSER